MGYWGTHPIEGDTPLDNIGAVEWWLYETLISDIEAEESSGKNENISDSLRNFVIESEFDAHKFSEKFDELDNEIYFSMRRDLWNTYKHDMIIHFKDEEPEFNDKTYFVIPFKFIDMDIHVKSKYVSYLVEMLGDGGAEQRGYPMDGFDSLDSFKIPGDHPYYYVLLVKKYATQLFDESNNELNDEFVAAHPEITNVVSKGLFESAFKLLEETGQVPFMNVQ